MHKSSGFTLIELAIVLVIIGLVVGGVLVGQDLIKTSEIRAQITQFEKYQAAVNTFRGKYNCIPGDCKNAADFGFTPRGSTWPYTGDGNGLLTGAGCCCGGSCIAGTMLMTGETALFWRDLSDANLIDQSFSTGQAETNPGSTINGDKIALYIPRAKLARGLFVYAYNGANTPSTLSPVNYFGLSKITQIYAPGDIYTYSSQGVAVSAAYFIDQKTDDGYPQTGNMFAAEDNGSPYPVMTGPTNTAATAPSATTCYDNGNSAGAVQRYSTAQDQGRGLNCALTVKFQ